MSTENADAPNVREMYRQLETPQGAHLERCPICEAEAALWQFSASRDAPVQRVVMCSHGDEIGPQDGIVNSGCLLYMPDEAFYQPTAREAIRYWNGFAVALRALRAEHQPAADSQKSSPEQQLRAENERLRIAAEDAAERMEVWNFSSANDIARNLRAALAHPAAHPDQRSVTMTGEQIKGWAAKVRAPLLADIADLKRQLAAATAAQPQRLLTEKQVDEIMDLAGNWARSRGKVEASGHYDALETHLRGLMPAAGATGE